jgi:DNA-binding MarR family transcriptional regulator
VELTEAGRQLVPKLAPVMQANNARFLQGVTEAELGSFASTIQKMLNNAETTVPSPEESIKA